MLKPHCNLPHKTLHREGWGTSINPNQFYRFFLNKKKGEAFHIQIL